MSLPTVLAIIISALSLLCSAIIVVLTAKRDNKADIEKQIKTAENFKEINVKLDYQANQMNTVVKNSELTARQMSDMNNKVALIENNTKTLFKYHDDHEARIKHLEKKE